MYEFLRNLFASEQPVMERFNVVDPTAVGNNVRSITLAYTPATDESPTAAVSLFWTDSKNKVYEKSFQDELQAQNLFGSMKQDLQEAADLTRTEKMESAASLVRSLLKRYAIYTDEIVDGNPEPKTLTNASLRKKKANDEELTRCNNCMNVYSEEQLPIIDDHGEFHPVCPVCKTDEYLMQPFETHPSDTRYAKVQNPLINKNAKVVMQNLFFETPEEMKKYQDMMKGGKPGAGKPAGDFTDDLPGANKEKGPEMVDDKEIGDEVGEDGLAPSSLSYEDYEKQKAQEQKSLTKRIEREVKEQVKSALEQKIASTFDETDDELIEAMRKKGRTWEEIKNYFIKELQYEKDSVAAYIDALREADRGPMAPAPKAPVKEPTAPKPPTDLVSPETHDKLVKEVEDKKPATPEEHEIEKQDMALGEIAAQNVEITKIAEEPLETVPKSRPSNMGGDFDFLPPETDMAEDMKEDPAASPDPDDLTDQQEEELIPGPDTKVYVMRDYQTGEGGFEGTLVSKYKSGGDEFAVVDSNGDMKEVPMRDVKRASMFRNLVKIVAARKEKRDAEKAERAQSELKSILAEINSVNEALTKEADSSVIMPMRYSIPDEAILTFANGSIYDKKIASGQMTDDDWKSLVWETGRWMPHVGLEKPSEHFPSKAEYQYDGEQIARIKNMFQNLPRQSALKKEAAPPKPALSPADPKVTPEPKVTGPELDEPWKKAPEGLREEKPVLAPQEVNAMYNKVKDTEIALNKIKTAVAEIMKKAQEDVRKFREQSKEQALTDEYQKGVQQLYSAIEPLNAKVVEVEDTLLAFIKETKREDVKWTAAEKLKKVMDKFPEVEKYLENALNGAQAQAQMVEKRMLIPFPKVKSSSQLSRFDKTADVMDVLKYTLDNLNAAWQVLKEITGDEPEAVPA